ncbi:glucan endo-1,6-beta-glucosidase [Marchantia polymorpha subsp. ruderalis]|uniref:glucan 1,3-beta-glucosidase n=1 Tax=Marchantia polymorpha TaxID=3197 RepID=A0A2R6XC23_MARPO|nr:hypothetical protein MARPO_0023s0008 [Marchantia polymorpha]BBN01800.1 hypothetical protein Mp_2g10380 [Marchantia polymorpha subsp. ruderalis]|eukprot:PTQ43664.1 hypothetical protein MARPO_0023s0008 [Marchantia polymorpha]
MARSVFLCLTLLLICLQLLSKSPVAEAWLPYQNPIRGVNLGGLFVVEKWMMVDQWASIGCGAYNDEWECVQALGQTAADAAFKRHWGSWITQADITQIASLGLNAVRIPVGFWMKEDLVRSDEHFPRGGLAYLENVCKMARDAGLYIIIDLHAGPGGQDKNQQFTGHSVSTPGFFNSYNYERAYQFLEWMTRLRHTNNNYANVGAIEVINEPRPQTSAEKASLVNDYYPTAYNRIRAVEDSLNIAQNDRLHIQMMDTRWGEGNPKQHWGSSPYFALYDDHKYLHWDNGVPATRRDYMYHSCYDDVGTGSNSNDKPLIVGEWSLSPRDEDNSEFDINRSDAVEFYKNWFAAQLKDYEKSRGWMFWTWKVNWINGRFDFRWGYQQSVQAGVIPSSPSLAVAMNACAPYGA